jgi:hypothetical protein
MGTWKAEEGEWNARRRKEVQVEEQAVIKAKGKGEGSWFQATLKGVLAHVVGQLLWGSPSVQGSAG